MTLIVTGMPRSGTSLLCGVLARLGVDFGPKFVRTDARAPTGYFENPNVIEFTRGVVAELGGENVTPGPDRAEAHPKFQEWVAEAQRLADRLPALKLPRLPLVAPLWETAAPDATLIVCVRHPYEVASSWAEAYGTAWTDGLDLWAFYYSRLLRLDALFVAYDRWWVEPDAQLDRVAAHVGVEPNPDALSVVQAQHRHYRHPAPHALYDTVVARCG